MPSGIWSFAASGAVRRFARAIGAAAIAPALLSFAGTPSGAEPTPWGRTETRAACADSDPLRRPHFGDLHVHTSFSQDAYIRATRVTPRDAYAFARGATVQLPDLSGASTRPVWLERALDFAAVTDHAEFFGEVRECLTPGSPAYDDRLCGRLRELTDPAGMSSNNTFFSLPLGLTNKHHAFCNLPGVDCAATAMTVWQETQAAAEEAYDRTDACRFTSFIGYEYTGAPLGAHLHRNVIFRNDAVPARVTSYLETLQNGAPQPLWDALEADCLDAGNGCEFLTIPHNSNLSNGLRWPDPIDAADAERRQKREPLVEIYQHKGASECRFDRLAGLGADTTDELCAFEQDPRAVQGPFPIPAIGDYPRRNLIRNALKDGLQLDASLGVNPFRFGILAGTDTHSGTAGATEENAFEGHRGGADADGPRQLAGNPLGGGQVRFGPGGLAVVWAEENARDALYAALARRETYGTSGTRPVIRFFAGGLEGVTCDAADFVQRAYATGVPMGGEIGPAGGALGPRFAVLAHKDPGTATHPGTDLQRVQIVKAWLDANGATHERVFDVAGAAAGQASVDPDTCAPVGAGAAELCAVWRDPDFDPSERALYYVRVLENPTCRWSTLVCKELGVDPLSPSCESQAAAAGDYDVCCLDASNDAFAEPVIQERAWTSPIWVRPEGVTGLRATLRAFPGRKGDRLQLALGVGAVPQDFDPTREALSLRLIDHEEIYAVTLAAGSLVAQGPGRWAHRDPARSRGGLESVFFSIDPNGGASLAMRAGLDLDGVAMNDHRVRVELDFGAIEVRHTRLWTAAGIRRVNLRETRPTTLRVRD